MSEEARTFEEVARSPGPWLSRARGLRAAAHTLWRAADFERTEFGHALHARRTDIPEDVKDGIAVAIGLAGLSLENLVKALLIKRDPSLVTKDGLSENLTTHPLRHLAQDAGLVLDPIKADFVERAEIFVTWSGRYPIPRRANPTPSMASYMAFGDDHSTFDALFNELESALQRP